MKNTIIGDDKFDNRDLNEDKIQFISTVLVSIIKGLRWTKRRKYEQKRINNIDIIQTRQKGIDDVW